ncbi:unnamed protein product [Pleuronectes platessa]|uniref:Uncharacterized protein n=1 Tax=Pleuronectes platessa TaxID=8262 RepID=A0A9N7UTC8_PLEPL|nr:unnamed protein product [Pleuronectes platessa]
MDNDVEPTTILLKKVWDSAQVRELHLGPAPPGTRSTEHEHPEHVDVSSGTSPGTSPDRVPEHLQVHLRDPVRDSCIPDRDVPSGRTLEANTDFRG